MKIDAAIILFRKHLAEEELGAVEFLPRKLNLSIGASVVNVIFLIKRQSAVARSQLLLPINFLNFI